MYRQVKARNLFTHCVDVCYSSDCDNRSHYMRIGAYNYGNFGLPSINKGGESDVLFCSILTTPNRDDCSKGVGLSAP